MGARIADADDGRWAAERMAARLCTQVQDLRAFGIAAEAGRVKVRAEGSACDICTGSVASGGNACMHVFQHQSGSTPVQQLCERLITGL